MSKNHLRPLYAQQSTLLFYLVKLRHKNVIYVVLHDSFTLPLTNSSLLCHCIELTCSQHCGKSSASTRVGPTCRANATHPVRIICLERKITAECYQTHNKTDFFGVSLHMRRCPNAHTPLLIVRSLDKIKEDVQQLVSFFGLGMQAGRTQNKRNQLLWTHTGTQVK